MVISQRGRGELLTSYETTKQQPRNPATVLLDATHNLKKAHVNCRVPLHNLLRFS